MKLTKKAILHGLEKNVLNTPIFGRFIAPLTTHLPLDGIKKNILFNSAEIAKKKTILQSLPYKGILNITDMCNLRCAFCEIHHIHGKFERVYPNFIDVNLVKKYSSWMQHLYNLDFCGNVGEPLLNKNFTSIIQHLKAEYGTRLFVNTNGTLLDAVVADAMVECGFDDVLVSMHAGTEETYKKLTGANFGKLVENVRYLVEKKKAWEKSKPLIGAAFALNRINAPDVDDFMALVVSLGIDYVALFHYYDVRNKLPKTVSLYFNPEEGNKAVDQMYDLAKGYGMRMQPVNPPYLPSEEEIENAMKGREIYNRKCNMPWTSIKFEGCVEYPDSHYITVCNRIILFRINYKEYDFGVDDGFDFIWNHPLLQYMRETANSDELNPICAFCQNCATPILRCVDNEEYRKRRDEAMRMFYQEAKKRHDLPKRKGLYLLDKNPYD